MVKTVFIATCIPMEECVLFMSTSREPILLGTYDVCTKNQSYGGSLMGTRHMYKGPIRDATTKNYSYGDGML